MAAPSPRSLCSGDPLSLGTVEGTSHAYPQPVLRSSCDACTAAKVRCDKQQPGCGRCRSLLRQCIYSLSKKHARSQLKRMHEVYENQHLVSEAFEPAPDLDKAQQNILFPQTQNRRHNSSLTAVLPDHLGGGSVLPRTPDSVPAHETTAALNYFRIDTTSSTISDLSRSALSYGSGENYQMYSAATSEAETSLGTANLICDEHTERPRGDGSGARDCCSLAAELLTELRALWRSQALTLDRILVVLKTARESISRLLLCPCTITQPTLFTLCYSAVSCMLDCVKKAANTEPVTMCIYLSSPGAAILNDVSVEFRSGVTSFPIDATGSNSGTLSDSLLASLPATIGDYDLDGEGRKVLGRQLLLYELRRIAALANEIALKHFESNCDDFSSTGANSPTREAHFADMFRKKLNDIARSIANRIDEAVV